MPVPPAGSLSFPPLLSQWKGAAQDNKFPGSDHTWKQALRPRPLKHELSQQTVSDLQVACGPRFHLLQQATNLDAHVSGSSDAMSSSMPPPNFRGSATNPAFSANPRGMPLYQTVWPETSPPQFSVFEYCKKVGHAPPPNSLPAPRVNDMKQWFATYGHPAPNAPTGTLSEFAQSIKSVPRSGGETSQQVRLYRGRVLR